MRFNMPEEEFRIRARQVKAVVFDLDDTLLDSEKKISRRALSEIQALQNRGIFVSICTARNCSATQYYADLLQINGVYSAGNGCQVVDGQTGEVLEAHSMQDQDAVCLTRFCLDHGASFSLSVGHNGYFGGPVDPDDNHIRPDIYHKRFLSPGRTMKRLTDANVLYGQNVYKIAVHDEDFYDVLSRYIQENLPSIQCMITSKEVINIFPAGYSKGTGILQIADHTGIPPERFCVFGDFLNDIPMFEVSGLSVAMGNSIEAVQRKASAVAGTADEDGVAVFLSSVFFGT